MVFVITGLGSPGDSALTRAMSRGKHCSHAPPSARQVKPLTSCVEISAHVQEPSGGQNYSQPYSAALLIRIVLFDVNLQWASLIIKILAYCHIASVFQLFKSLYILYQKQWISFWTWNLSISVACIDLKWKSTLEQRNERWKPPCWFYSSNFVLEFRK